MPANRSAPETSSSGRSAARIEPGRRLPNIVQGFLDYTEHINSKPFYRLWAGISLVAACMQRTCTVQLGDNRPMSSNLYTMLVGPPGCGKSTAILAAEKLLKSLESVPLAPDSLTRQALWDIIEEVHSVDTTPDGDIIRHSSLSVIEDEFGVFLEKDEEDFQTLLCKLYDAHGIVSRKIRAEDWKYLENPWLNILGGCTLVHLRDLFTSSAMEKGLPARFILVYDKSEMGRGSLFQKNTKQPKLERDLLHDLERVAQLKGSFDWTPDAMEAMDDWWQKGCQPMVEDRRFQHYNERRMFHLTKLCMILNAARSDGMTISLDDFKAAKQYLEATEKYMPIALSMTGENPYSKQQIAVLNMVREHYKSTGRPLGEMKIRRYLMEEVDPKMVGQIIEALIENDMLSAAGIPNSRRFWPMEETK